MSRELPLINLSVEIEGVPTGFSVHEATLTEGLSKPFELELTVRSHVAAVHPELLIGRSVHFTYDRAPVLRSVHGVVEEVEVVGDTPMSELADSREVRLKIVPAFKLLEHRKNSRIFQDLTVLRIIRDVLLGESAPAGGHPEGLSAFGRTYDPSALNEGDYSPNRDYCVQYKESDFAFVSRLLEEEGIAYRFEHMRVGHEVMVLSDSNLTFPPLETAHVAPVLQIIERDEVQGQEGLFELNWTRARKTDKTLFRHWDWIMPREGSESSHERDETESPEDAVSGALGHMTSYRHSDERSREEYEDGRMTRVHAEGSRRNRIKHQREKALEWVARGKSNAIGMLAGRIFEHDGDGAHSVLVIGVKHHFEVTDHGAHATYDNEFEAVPHFRTFRPKKKHKRTKIEGPQTAIVTGPDGAEIHTDEHGRVKLLMHWDRDGEGAHRRDQRHDAGSSCWVRVAQMMAGSGWGGWWLPRVGMEVVVQFLDGNADKPLVTGCVYNGEHRTPYRLPDEKTKSTIKSNSTPGGEGFNELRFEDAAGAEEIWLHGQRDYNSAILRRHTMTVGENQTYDVTGDRSRRVGGSESVHVQGNQSITVDGGGDQGVKGIQVTVVETYKLGASKDIFAEAPVKVEIKCEGSMIELTPGQIILRAGDGAEIVLNKDVLARSKDQSELKMDKEILARANKGAQLQLQDRAELSDTNGSRVELDSTVTVESCDGASTVYDADAVTKGTVVKLTADDSTELKMTGDAAGLTSTDISLSGESSTEVEGGGGRAVFSGGRVGLN